MILHIRNLCYDHGLYSSYRPKIKSIVVGNLSVGGTGKTPHIDYLIKYFTEMGLQVSVVSRGYGRLTKGHIEVLSSHSAKEVGDEPLQLKTNNSDADIFVDEDRVHATKVIESKATSGLVLYDDAFQHRKIDAGLNILLSDYNRPFLKDFPLPSGKLREWPLGAKRADVIIFTKCPELSTQERVEHRQLYESKYGKPVLYSQFGYGKLYHLFTRDAIDTFQKDCIAITGIANPISLHNHLRTIFKSVKEVSFRDHYNFKLKDILRIREIFSNFAGANKVLVTTEKDAMRLQEFKTEIQDLPIYVMPVEVVFNSQDEAKFDEILRRYVRND
ncbi:MAG: tetraacyldisaccharide 4'-kinase [Flavobacteriales bacterium]|nr:tetraacyldisaccharide 4'-kinase [Flavobacteriales bacterium]